jgi:type I restriction enzyme R subunit
MPREAERATRKQRIDPRLIRAGWSVVPLNPAAVHSTRHTAIEEYETRNGPADYALCNGGHVQGVVEAKKGVAWPARSS